MQSFFLIYLLHQNIFSFYFILRDIYYIRLDFDCSKIGRDIGES